jgi:hypothetical protein
MHIGESWRDQGRMKYKCIRFNVVWGSIVLVGIPKRVLETHCGPQYGGGNYKPEVESEWLQ